jgi:hypothetical protein
MPRARMIGAPEQEAIMGNVIPSLYQAFFPPYAARMRKSLCIAALACLLVAAPAPAHTIDVRSAAAAAREAASTLGEVDKAKCWRPVIGRRLARHRSICVAWWVHGGNGRSCTIFYEVRVARRPSRHLVVIQTYQPWCASVPRDLPIDVQGLSY